MTGPTGKRAFVMTGATSGLGAVAAARIAAQPATLSIVGARSTHPDAPAGAEVLPLDLASLDDVRGFANAVLQRTEASGIDVLVLNAGAQFRNADERSADGFELTFAVNHLAHYLLARVLLPAVADGGRIVVTTSDTHDPKIFRSGPKKLDVEGWAHPPNGSSSGFRAYAASKACNLMTARSLAALDEVEQRHITVIAYNPGLTGGTSLARAQPRAIQVALRATKPVFWFLSRFRGQFSMHTPEQSGEVLSQLALGSETPPAARVYASLVKGEITYPDPSELAQSDEACDQLWRESAKMVGLTCRQ